MKRCPECRRDYYDDSLLYCLDDGTALLEGPASATEPATAILSGDPDGDDATRQFGTAGTKPSGSSFPGGPRSREKSRSVLLPAIAALLIIGAGVALAIYKFSGAQKRGESFQPGKIERLTGTGNVLNVAIAPDGKFVTYVLDETGRQSVWIRDVATTSSVQIVAPVEAEFTGLSFSRDGNYVYYSKVDRGTTQSILYSVAKLGGAPRKVLADVDSSVTFSPDGKRMAFFHWPDNKNSALMVAGTDGTNEQKLAAPEWPDVFESAPAWSLDGKIIACPMYHTEGNAFYAQVAIVSVADGTTKPLSSKQWQDIEGKMSWESDGRGLLLVARDSRSTWSNKQIWRLGYPDGDTRQLTQSLTGYHLVSATADTRALVTVTDDISSSLWRAPINGAAPPNQISSTPGRFDGYCGLAWMNDGKIVLTAKEIANTDIWKMNPDGSGREQLTNNEDVERYLSVPRDNRYLVFDLLRKGEGNVWRSDTNGGDPKQLTTGSWNVEPDVSPDGKWVVYRDANATWKVPIDGGQPVRLLDAPVRFPAFSPDGKLIACYNENKLSLISSDGGKPLKVFDVAAPTTGSGSAGPRLWVVLRWTPDGRSVLFVADKDGASNIWSQPVDGGAPTQITDFKSDLIWTFDISPDGKQLIMSRGRNINDVVLINNAAP